MKGRSKTEWIERYLDGELSADELIHFEAWLTSEPDLKEELDLHRSIRDALGDSEGLAAYEAMTASTISDQAPASTSMLSNRPVILILFLVIIAVIALMIWINRDQSPRTPFQLFEQYQDIPDTLPDYALNMISRSGQPRVQGQIDSLWENFQMTYNNGSFERSQMILNRIAAIQTPDATFHFFQGLIFLKTADYPSAQAEFRKAAPLQDMCYWYMALIQLHKNNADSASILLGRLADSKHPRQAEARAILNQLNRQSLEDK